MTRPIHIRPMTRRDLPQVRRIERAAYQDAWPDTAFDDELANGFASYIVAVPPAGEPAPPPSGLAGRVRARLRPGEANRAGEQVLGFAGAWYMVDQLHLVTLAVDPALQGGRIGSRLLLEVFGMAEEAELPAIVLEVRPSNARARDLYARFGFREAGTLRGYYRDNGEDALVLMTPALDEPEQRARLEGLRAEVTLGVEG